MTEQDNFHVYHFWHSTIGHIIHKYHAAYCSTDGGKHRCSRL